MSNAQPVSWVRKLTENLGLAIPSLRAKKLREHDGPRSNNCSVPDEHKDDECRWESAAARRQRIIAWACKEAKVSEDTWPSWMSNTRRPGVDQKLFFALLKQYGR